MLEQVLEHGISAFIGIALVVTSVVASYKVAKSFFGSEHARTDKSGDFGSAKGSVFAFLLPAMVCMAVMILATKVVTIHFLGVYVLLILALGLGSAIYGAFSNIPRKTEDGKSDAKPEDAEPGDPKPGEAEPK